MERTARAIGLNQNNRVGNEYQGDNDREVCGPVRIQIEGFRPIFNELAFVEMKPADGDYEPLIGYIILEQSQAAVDMLGHRLVPIKHMDLK
jgi:hypothetical protein